MASTSSWSKVRSPRRVRATSGILTKNLPRCCIPAIDALDLAIVRSPALGYAAGPMEVQIRIEVLPIEPVEGGRVIGTDMTEADVLANHRPILEFAAIVGMKSTNMKWELFEHGLQ